MNNKNIEANKNDASKNQTYYNLQNINNPRSVWGAIVTKLREQKRVALYTACGEIREIKIENSTLIITIREEFLYKTLTEAKNFSKLQDLLKQVNKNLDLKFNLIKRKDDRTLINIKRLEQVVGKDLEIIP